MRQWRERRLEDYGQAEDDKALAINVRGLKSLIGDSVALFAVVKANAYGHGAVRVARTGIRRKIWTVYVLQVAAISLATILGVYGAATVLEDVLIKRALDGEATYYWQRYARDANVPVHSGDESVSALFIDTQP